jgi:hypothetical protein
MSMTSKVFLFGARVLGGTKRHWQSDDPDQLNSFPAKAIEGLHRFFGLLPIETHFVKGCKENDFSLAAIIDENFSGVPSVDVDGDDHGVYVGELWRWRGI